MTQGPAHGNLIVFVDDAHTFGGAQIALAWAIRTILSETGDRVLCVSTGRTRQAIEEVAGISKRLEFMECPSALPFNVLAFPMRIPVFFMLLLRIRQRGVHAWWLSLPDIQFCLAPLVVLRWLGEAPIGWLHNTERAIFFFPRGSRLRRILSRLRDWLSERFVFNLYPLILTPSRATASALSARLRGAEKPLLDHLYYPPIGNQSLAQDSAQGTPLPEQENAIDLWMIGRIEYGHKNNLLGLELLALLLRQGVAAKLTVVGDGPDRADLEAHARELGLEDRVSFVGWKVDPWDSVPRHSVVMIPSLYESMCIVAREAMTRRIALVVSPIDVFHEWIPAALIAPSFSADAFAKTLLAVRRLTANELGAMYATALARFSAATFAEAFKRYSEQGGHGRRWRATRGAEE
jgi:glycosyltransferase involved in cell wall biosynthesis